MDWTDVVFRLGIAICITVVFVTFIIRTTRD